LERSGTGYFFDRRTPSYVDLALFCELLELSEADKVPTFALGFELPRLGNLLENHDATAGTSAKYVRSPRRAPRYKRPGYTYVE